MLSQDQIDDVILDARAGDLDELKAFFQENDASVLPQIKDEYSFSTALHMASANGHVEVVEYLLELANDDVKRQILDAKNESGNTPLHWAALNGHLEVVKLLCDAGAQPFTTNEANHDVFYEAEQSDKGEIIDYLLQKFSIEPEDDEKEAEGNGGKKEEDDDGEKATEKVTDQVKDLNV